MAHPFSLEQIADAVIRGTGVSLKDMKSGIRNNEFCMARGIFYVLARESSYPSQYVAEYLNRKRPTVVLTTQKYMGYLAVGDKLTKYVYDKVKELLI